MTLITIQTLMSFNSKSCFEIVVFEGCQAISFTFFAVFLGKFLIFLAVSVKQTTIAWTALVTLITVVCVFFPVISLFLLLVGVAETICSRLQTNAL